ncbi:MAG: cytochrome-c peroxidase [Bacteroidetes bacterium]|nr:cytochrome-c peroxidase [Bacteroidota bacterium]
MKLNLFFLLLIVAFCCAFQFAKDSLFQVPPHFPKPVYNFVNNALTKERIFLGRVLFYDPILSRNNTISCASCHSPYSAFAHVDHALSHGIDDKIGIRNAPALFNLAWHDKFMRDGAINHLDMQALAPISNASEMDENISNVVDKLQTSAFYRSLFFDAYGDSMVTGELTLKAISQFMLTLVSANAKYDSVMLGKSNFTSQEKSGYDIFRNNCNSCHTEPLFTNNQLMRNGLPIDSLLNDYGRYTITKLNADSLKFKVPSLRNIEFTFPYMHDGRFKKLNDVINHYVTTGSNKNDFESALNHPIQLTSDQKVDLIAFLLTLSDKQFLIDSSYHFPREILNKMNK